MAKGHAATKAAQVATFPDAARALASGGVGYFLGVGLCYEKETRHPGPCPPHPEFLHVAASDRRLPL